MKLTLTHDPEHDVFTIGHIDVRIRNTEDVAEWRRQLIHQLEARISEPVDLLIDLEGFHLEPQMMEYYGRHAKEIVSRYGNMVVRYGLTDVETKATVLLQSVVNRYPANIFPDRASAIAAVKKIRDLG